MMPPVSIEPVMLRGGLDQITPTLSLPSGVAREALNFECAVTGGYTRVTGYERFDGHASPADSSQTYRYIVIQGWVNVPAVGETVTSSGAGTGVVAYVFGLTMVICKVVGSWANAQTVTVGATPIGTISNAYGAAATIEGEAISRNAVADIYRLDIAAVPGSGAIRGVIEFGDTVYAFRDDVAGTAQAIYKSAASGWTLVPLPNTVSFTAGGTATPADGATLTEGGVTATIARVVRTSGSWQAGTAAGQFIIGAVTGGHFSAGAATAGTVGVTISGAESAITLTPGGKYELQEMNFSGQSATNRVYGVDGKNKAFEFDGTTYVPIATGATVDTPQHIAFHKGFLFLFIGGSMIHSSPGLPYDFTALGGAAELAVGYDVTGAISMPGGTGSATLGVFGRSNTSILYGTGPADWNLVFYNTGTGGVPYTLQNMAQTYAFDDRGVNAVQTSLQYGNFTQSTLTASVLPFINDHIGDANCATLCRRKSQYRLFFNDGYALFITVVNGKLLGCMPVYFPDVVSCVYEGKTSTGMDVIYFGSSNGMIYQMEKGTSFDGAAIPFFFTTTFSSAKSPRTLKRYRKAVPEVTALAGGYASFSFSYSLGYGGAEYNQGASVFYDTLAGTIRWDSGLTWDSGLLWDTSGTRPIECEVAGTAENIAVLITGNSDYVAPFGINSFLIHFTPRRMMR